MLRIFAIASSVNATELPLAPALRQSSYLSAVNRLPEHLRCQTAGLRPNGSAATRVVAARQAAGLRIPSPELRIHHMSDPFQGHEFVDVGRHTSYIRARWG